MENNLSATPQDILDKARCVFFHQIFFSLAAPLALGVQVFQVQVTGHVSPDARQSAVV